MVINPAQQVNDEREHNAAIEAVRSNDWAEGHFNKLFRQKLKKYLGVKHVTLVNSGSSANLIAMMALTSNWIPKERRINNGDEVITTALCFPTTISPIYYAKATPVFIDVDQTWNIDPEMVERAITHRTKAIMVAHALGSPFKLSKIKEICIKHNLWLIEDNCDALGSEWNGQKTGSFGDIGTSSFYPAHHISCGEGGAVYTSNPLLAKAIVSMTNWGRNCYCDPNKDNTCRKRYEWQLGDLPFGYDHKNTYSDLGFNVKMGHLQAALGCTQMDRIDEFVEKRRENHKFLYDIFKNYQHIFDLPVHHPEANPSWFGYVIKLKNESYKLKIRFDRDKFVQYLDSVEIRSRAFFCGNILKQPVFAGNIDGKGVRGEYRFVQHKKISDLSKSDDVMFNAFWIGVHPGIGDEQRAYLKEHITKFLDENT